MTIINMKENLDDTEKNDSVLSNSSKNKMDEITFSPIQIIEGVENFHQSSTLSPLSNCDNIR